MLLYVIHPAVIVLWRMIAKAAGQTKLLVENTFILYVAVCTLSVTNQRAEQNKNGRKKKAVSGIAGKAEYTVIKRRKQGRSFYKPVVAVPEQSGSAEA